MKLTAAILAVFTFFSQLLGLAGSGDYRKQTGLREAVSALVQKQAVTAERIEGAPSEEEWSPDRTFGWEDVTVLQKQAGRDFVILNFSDIHFSDYDYRAWFAFEGEAAMRRLVAETHPDLITLSGDIVCGDSTAYAIRRVTDLMESFGVPWAPVFGNHDGEANLDLNALADVMLKSPHCLMKKGDPRMGVGNYVLAVTEARPDGTDALCEALIMMDSHGSQPNALQLDWCAWAADGVNALSGGAAEISVMMHIPLPEYQLAYDAAWNEETGKWNEGFGAQGALHEKICCERDETGAPLDRGFFAMLQEKGTVRHVLCGHDHMNDFSIEYEGIRLTYMLKLGYASGFQPGYHGCTVLRVGGTGIARITHKSVSAGIAVPIVDVRLSDDDAPC